MTYSFRYLIYVYIDMSAIIATVTGENDLLSVWLRRVSHAAVKDEYIAAKPRWGDTKSCGEIAATARGYALARELVYWRAGTV